jgi:hypothetical protein
MLFPREHILTLPSFPALDRLALLLPFPLPAVPGLQVDPRLSRTSQVRYTNVEQLLTALPYYSIALGVAALGGAAYYVLSQPAAKEQLNHDVSVVKGKVEDMKSDRRSLTEKAQDVSISQRNLAGSKADPYLEKAIGKAEDVKEEAKGWFGKGESAADAAKRKVEEEKYFAQKKGGEIKEEVSRHFVFFEIVSLTL